VHLVGFVIRIYHDARSSECQIFRAQLLIITLKFYCFGYCNLTNLTLEFADPETKVVCKRARKPNSRRTAPRAPRNKVWKTVFQ
jgi:hypothetical protein